MDYPVFIRHLDSTTWLATCRDFPGFSSTGTIKDEAQTKVAHDLYMHLRQLVFPGGNPPKPSRRMSVEQYIRPKPYSMTELREVASLKHNTVNAALVVAAKGEYYNGAQRFYSIESAGGLAPEDYPVNVDIHFHVGNPEEVGVTGITHESLISVVIDRLECFQNTEFADMHSSVALDHLRKALEALSERTKERQARGVEGTATP